MSLIEDRYSDTVGQIRFPKTSSLDYEAISDFYRITGAVPLKVEECPDADCAMHLVRLRSLPSLTPMGRTTTPTYTVEYETDSFERGITRMVIRDSDKRCVIRYERDSSGSGWSSFAFEMPRLRYFID